jgi:hypothetical protein
LKLDLTGIKSNADAIGAKVRVKATIQGEEMWQLRNTNGVTPSHSTIQRLNDLPVTKRRGSEGGVALGSSGGRVNGAGRFKVSFDPAVDPRIACDLASGRHQELGAGQLP